MEIVAIIVGVLFFTAILLSVIVTWFNDISDIDFDETLEDILERKKEIRKTKQK